MDRPLQFLPPLAAGEVICLLPLSDFSAAALASALLEENPGARVARMEESLRADPALTIWTAVHPRRPKTPPHDFGQLTAWLASEASSVLRWPSEPPGELDIPAALLQSRWAPLAENSLNLASRAERFCGDAHIAARARLFAFLADVVEWLIAGVRPRGGDAVERLAPQWLRRFSITLRQPRIPDDPALAAVAQALASREDATEPDAAVSNDAIARWSGPLPGISECLPLLSAKLNRLASLEQEFEETLRREKLASLQKLAYGASHEINNPLANIASRAQALLQEENDPERRRALATINDQAFRAFEMIANMMLFAKPPDLDLAPTDLREVIGQVVDELTPAAQQQGTTLRTDAPSEPVILRADAVQLAVLLRAMCRNALEAVECGGEVIVSAWLQGDQAELSVRDTGPGLSDEARRHLFDPFYSGREAGRGLGFGLSWCWTIVELHHGRIALESAPGKGTTFLVTLPVNGPE